MVKKKKRSMLFIGAFRSRMQDLPFLLRRLLRELMDPQRSLPLVIRARVQLIDKLGCIDNPTILTRKLGRLKKGTVYREEV
ncbi:hypothetical protein RCOM_1331300 [Ricinus communis]|uniref:Uncharacterized protein n=1 Tax=Ricinus communis TaxID=3988 RepID=B9S710_RICCO|nr:hypothetical protein RCOM_1331300 [Ricinus communis]